MSQPVVTITLPLPFRLGSVNCYLLRADDDFILIDTGSKANRKALNRALVKAGCNQGDLRLVILTHGDFDHTGNAAYLRAEHGAEIVMHHSDAGMVERGDMFWNRGKSHPLVSWAASLIFGFRKAERFAPDENVGAAYTLADHGLDACTLHIPGHSAGSMAILTTQGELFCGDLLESTRGPALNAIISDSEAARASVAMLNQLEISTVYPGHGRPFLLSDLHIDTQSHRSPSLLQKRRRT